MDQVTEDSRKRSITSALGYLGLLPFVGSALLSFLQGSLWNLAAEQIFISYSAIILSFMAGTLWGKVLSAGDEGGHQLAYIVSNLIALAAWGTVLWSSRIPAAEQWSLAILALGYVITWHVEKSPRVGQSSHCPTGYGILRQRLTTAVVVLHLVMVVNVSTIG